MLRPRNRWRSTHHHLIQGHHVAPAESPPERVAQLDTPATNLAGTRARAAVQTRKGRMASARVPNVPNARRLRGLGEKRGTEGVTAEPPHSLWGLGTSAGSVQPQAARQPGGRRQHHVCAGGSHGHRVCHRASGSSGRRLTQWWATRASTGARKCGAGYTHRSGLAWKPGDTNERLGDLCDVLDLEEATNYIHGAPALDLT